MGEGVCCAALSMSEPDFSQSVVAHESAFVHISVDAVEMSFTRVLPQYEVEVVFQHRLSCGVLGNHHLVVAQEPQQVVVVEIGTRVEQWLLLVSFSTRSRKMNNESLKASLLNPLRVSMSIMGNKSWSPGLHWVMKFSSCVCCAIFGR